MGEEARGHVGWKEWRRKEKTEGNGELGGEGGKGVS